ncbi:hypothetical protein COCMIDRAFT_8917 [Bipolaris oryzae ATCC 44560]|uniref:NACHT domain-containing protein n=1 Tax=Bipolaris oryzae ATCC 44560 TaxID=930090 RepID=W6YUX5_COCMI|nr:uncharacterized protein COCMIDRAFT_8917 [Bipolaris oryzae ATCC 44560]EUC41350.1 hypothetical protein COCMIDRAFT_8917 [Bipolaris oryzae ATCC 44560]
MERFSDGLAPPYAILSHTWGQDNDEVTFADIVDGKGKDKAGYKKIYFCDIQAQSDSLQYFWIDTCCINKDDKAELSQAIQSMFRWYQNAKTCYVYLSDAMFRSSRWFTRGWTLQELIAPCTVRFFSKEGDKLGDRSLLRCLINKITSIPLEVLDGGGLSQFKNDERQRWANDRNTKLEEDKAYALSGLCGVHIAPVYGEGKEEAFRRLRREIEKLETCIRHLRDSDPHNRTFQQWQHDRTSQLLWVKGDPGKGKTMLLCGIIDEIQKDVRRNTVAYFFCQATDSRINNAVAVLRGLLYMLLDQQPLLARHVLKQHEHAGKWLFMDANAWVALKDIFRDVLQDPNLGRTCLVVDALDECIVDLPKLLDFVAIQSSKSGRVKWIVSSRNWPDIEAQLERAGHKIKLSLELNADSIATAVDAFIEKKVKILASEKQYTPKLQLEVLRHLTSNANDTFLWVALACQNLEKTSKRHVQKRLTQFPPGLDALYERMMNQVGVSEDADTCLQVSALAAVSYRPITISELVTLAEKVQENADDVEEIVSFCGSFLTLREGIVYFVHQSAKDFLLTKAVSQIFPGGVEVVHCSAFLRSMGALSSTLHKDIYELKEQGIANDDVDIPAQDPLASVRYSCTYWADHLCDSNPDWSANAEKPKLIATIEGFFKVTYLHWIEALSLCQSVEKGVVAVAKVLQLVQNDQGLSELALLIYDAWRFIMHHKNMIKRWPLQIYTSGILFSPRKSIIKNIFKSQAHGWDIQPDLEHDWSACLQTLEGHSDRVNSVAFSSDGARLASGSDDKTVKIWDAHSGQCLQTIEIHSSRIESVSFSPNDTTRVSLKLYNRTVKIWDLYSGECLQTLWGHTSQVDSVAFSSDGTRVVSASQSQIKIWDWHNGQYIQTLEVHSRWVNLAAFSADGTKLLSLSDSTTIMIWDAYSGQFLQKLEGHEEWINSAVFSPDGMRLASALGNKTVKIWDAQNGHYLQKPERNLDLVDSVAFSSDGARLVSASTTGIKIWDAYSGQWLKTLKGNDFAFKSAAFSLDGTRLVSVSSDIKIWDAYSGQRLQTLRGYGNGIISAAFSADGTHIISGNDRFHLDASTVGTTNNIIDIGHLHDIDTDIILSKEWVSIRGKNILWIPEGFRGSMFAVRNNKTAVAKYFGRIWICTVGSSL